MFEEEHGVLVLLPAIARNVENFAGVIEFGEVVACGVDSFEPDVCSLRHNHNKGVYWDFQKARRVAETRKSMK